jgi:multidrug efflux pump
MNFSAIFINRPVLATVVSIIIVLFGIIGFTYLGVREFPSVDPPVVTVTTNYTGANADVIESQITEVLEESINGIAGIRSLSSISTDGRSTITVEFELEVDLEAAANDVRDRVSRSIRRLPPDVDPPTVAKSDADAFPIVSMTISSPNRSLLELTDIAQNLFKERLQTIPGVSVINIWGEKKYAMKLQIDPAKLSAYSLTPLDVRNALNKENIELPSGRIEGFGQELTIRTLGRLTKPEEFENLIIKEQNGDVIKLKDIGKAYLAPENERTLLRGDYTYPQVAVAATPQPGSNHIEIADEFFKRVEQIKKEAPQDLNYNVVVNSTTSIRAAISEVEETILLAFILVVIVIFIFLRAWRTTLIPVIAIPISLIGSFFIMYVMGFSINILTLLAIVLATGIVVDDAIVVMENIYAKIEKGMEPMEAGYKGTQEIIFAIISTTVTLAAVFLPIIFLQGITGRLFREFGIVVAGAVIISAIVSLTLTPMMSARLLRHSKNENRFFIASENFFIWLGNAYTTSLTKFMSMRWVAIIIMLISFAAIIGLGMLIPSELAPMEDKSRLSIFSTAPEGVSFELMDEYMKDVMRVLDDTPEKKTALTVTAPSFGSNTAVNSGFARVALVEPGERTKSQQQVVDELTAKFKKMTFARTFVSQEQTIGGDRRGGLPIQYIIQAPNFEKLKEVLPKFMQQAQQNAAFQVVDLNLKFNKPELSIEIDRDRARALGVTVADIAETLQLYFSGQRFGYFIMDGKQYQVIGQASRDNRDEPLDLSSVNIRNNRGELIQLDNLVKLANQSSPPQLYRYNRYVSATVSVSPATGVTLGQGIDEMDKIAASVLDDSFSTSLTGTAQEFKESSNSLMFAFLLALVLIYLILAAQFESFIDPLIIMLTVPLALVGAIISLYLFGQTLNIFSQIGIIVLIGIVTKNGILIVEFANQLKEEGLSIKDAVVGAASQRFRPILMTSLATVLGALPIAMGLGAASKSRVPMGIVIIGGLLFSLALTLYVIPALYTYLSRKIQTSKLKVQPGIAITLILIFSIFQFSNSTAQQTQQPELLTLEQAIQIGLQNNYNIILAKNDAAISSNNNSLITTGFVPTVAANLQQNNSLYNTEQVFLDGRQQSGNNASSKSVVAGLQLNWTIFDGTKMFVTKNKLEEIESLSNIQTRATIENAVASIQNTYFAIVQQEQYVKVIQEALQLSAERLKIADAKFRLGSASELTVLQTKVDMNADSSNLLQYQSAIIKNKAVLNELLARDVTTQFLVDTTIHFAEQINYDNLLTTIETDNPQLLAARISKEIAALNVKELRTNYGPRISLYGAYNYNWQKNEVGFLQTNRSYGPAYGLTASFNIFDGMQTRRNTQNAKIEVQSAQTNYEYSLNNVKSMLYRAYQDYVANLQLVKLESSNIDVAKKNVVVAMERYKLGNINDIELRETQLKLVDAQSRLLLSQYQTKLAEVELFRLTGKLSN